MKNLKFLKIILLLGLFFTQNSFGQTFTNTATISIPDYPASIISYPISVSGLPTTINSSFGLTGLCFNINHTYVGDLVIQLQSPDGTIIYIANRIGGGNDNYTNTCLAENGANGNLSAGTSPFTGIWIPLESLNLLNNGQNPNGIWNLKIKDFVQSDSGNITNCSILFSSNPPPSLPIQPITIMPKKAFDYYNEIGVNTHLRFNSTPYYSQFNSIIYPRLKELGIKNIRDGLPYDAFLNTGDEDLIRARFIQLNDSLGIKVSYLLDSPQVVDTLDLRYNATYLSVLENSPALRNTVKYIEGFNEPNLTIYSWHPSNWDSLTHTIQKSMWDRVQATSTLSNFPVVAPSFVGYWTNPSRPNMVAAISPHISNYFDYANFHTYDGGSNDENQFPGHNYTSSLDKYAIIQQGKPFVITEVGYENAIDWNTPSSGNYSPDGYHYLSELAAAKYYSVLFMEMFNRGAKTIYTYEFIDQNTTNQSNAEMNFGLIHSDGSLKPAFTVIKNTLNIFKDTSTNFIPTNLTFNITGSTVGIKYAVYQKSNGNYLIGLWQDITVGVCYNYAILSDLPADSQAVQLTLPFNFVQAYVYQPLVSNIPINSFVNTNILNLNVPDNLIVVEICVNPLTVIENNLEKEFSIYPNPASDFITIQSKYVYKNENIQFYNSIGQLVKETTISTNAKITVSELSDGIYFIHLKNNPSRTLKFIKQ